MPPFEVYNLSASSWRYDQGCPTGINNRDIDQAMEWLEIPDKERLGLAAEVQTIINVIIRELTREREQRYGGTVKN